MLLNFSISNCLKGTQIRLSQDAQVKPHCILIQTFYHFLSSCFMFYTYIQFWDQCLSNPHPVKNARGLHTYHVHTCLCVLALKVSCLYSTQVNLLTHLCHRMCDRDSNSLWPRRAPLRERCESADGWRYGWTEWPPGFPRYLQHKHNIIHIRQWILTVQSWDSKKQEGMLEWINVPVRLTCTVNKFSL